MAREWIKMRLDLAEDPTVMAMADEMGVREEVVVGYLHSIWSWLSRQSADGLVVGVSLTALGRRLNLPGFPEIMVQHSWLEYSEVDGVHFITVPKWENHLSNSAKQRAQEQEKKRLARMSPSCPQGKGTSVPKAYAKNRDQKEKEKEKENKELTTNVVSCAGTSGDVPSSAGGGFYFLLKGGKAWNLPNAKYLEYLATYGDLDVDQELRKARQWYADNKPRRPASGRGYKSALTAWLNRSLDRQGGSKRDSTTGKRQPQYIDAVRDWEKLRAAAIKEEPSRRAWSDDQMRAFLDSRNGSAVH